MSVQDDWDGACLEAIQSVVFVILHVVVYGWASCATQLFLILFGSRGSLNGSDISRASGQDNHDPGIGPRGLASTTTAEDLS